VSSDEAKAVEQEIKEAVAGALGALRASGVNLSPTQIARAAGAVGEAARAQLRRALTAALDNLPNYGDDGIP